MSLVKGIMKGMVLTTVIAMFGTSICFGYHMPNAAEINNANLNANIYSKIITIGLTIDNSTMNGMNIDHFVATAN
jgi:hypothetical protein